MAQEAGSLARGLPQIAKPSQCDSDLASYPPIDKECPVMSQPTSLDSARHH